MNTMYSSREQTELRQVTLLTRRFLAWIFVAVFVSFAAKAQTVTVTNTLANGYNYAPFAPACAGGQTVANIPSGYHIERPHVVFNATSNQWVMWAHYDNGNYTTAQALVATSPTQCGTYTIYQTFQPLGYQIRDDFLFKDTDGTAYFIAASNKNGGANDTMAIFRLTSNYLNVDSSAGVHWVFENAYREAPIVVKSGSTYFLLTSQAAGWFPSQGGYGTSSSMLGTWSTLANLGNTSTFGGQEADVLTFAGTSATSYVLVMDHLGGNSARDDGNLFLPLVLDGTAKTATLDWYPSYTVNTSTGIMTLPAINNLSASGTASASSATASNPASLANDRSYYTEWVASSSSFPAWWMVDLGSAKHVSEVEISWWMYKGSEAYYQYKIDYSNDGVNFTSIDRTSNKMYGFTVDKVNFTARYLKVEMVNAVLQNNPNNWYTPQLYHVRVLP